MPLEDDIRDLASRSRAALDSLHDYYTHTKNAWRIVRLYAREHGFTIHNRTTGTVLNEKVLLDRAQGYVSGQLATGTFKESFAIFEEFLFGLLRLWLTTYPGSLSDLQVTFGRILKVGTVSALTQDLIGERLNRRQYQGVKDWFKYLNAQMALGVPSADQIDRIAELKASRDILEHHQGIVTNEYRRKSGRLARFNAGQQLEIPESYHRESWTLLRNVIGDIADAAAMKAAGAKAGPSN
jgi:hypothetical protein